MIRIMAALGHNRFSIGGHFFDVRAAARRPEAIHAVCEDYKAFIDLHHEADYREAGRRIGQPRAVELAGPW